MSKKDEALKLALEALELCNGAQTAEGVVVYTDKEITALREALAEQPAQQALDKMAENARELGLDYEPAQRTWVGLTDADKQEAFDETQEASGGFWEFADYLEAKLKEKNT